MQVLVSCANGSGTSSMMLRGVEKALGELNIPVTKSHHCSITEGQEVALQYDAIFCPLTFVGMFDDAKEKGVAVVGIKNVMSAKEIKERIENETDLVKKFA